jgi:RNA polymerase sigma-70 factor (ECF subfamily)
MQVAMQDDNLSLWRIEKAKGGDAAAFGELFSEHRARLCGLIRSRIGARLRGVVEVDDVLQETFARAFQSMKQFEWKGEGSFLRWLGGIAENILRKSASARARRTPLHLNQDVADTGVSPSRAARRGERFDRLQKALDKLTPEQREVLRLARLEGLKLKEVAARTNRSVEAVQQLMLRGLRQLRKHFGETESLHLPEWPLDPGQEKEP